MSRFSNLNFQKDVSFVKFAPVSSGRLFEEFFIEGQSFWVEECRLGILAKR